jgi:hypothetical protein
MFTHTALSRYSVCVVLASCLLASACTTPKDIAKTLGDLTVVRAELMKKFSEQDVNVRVNTFQNRTIFSVVYVNSPLNQKTAEERGARAYETVQIVRQHYPSIKNVSEIWVGYMRMTTRLVIFHWSAMIESYGFDGEGRSLHDPNHGPLDPTRPEIRYSPSQNTTDISSTGIQLEGTPEKGVILVAHFSVVGNVHKITPKPPDEVGLDFAAFSEKPKFPNLTKLAFLVDNKIVYRTQGQFSASKVAGEKYCEFLYLKVPTAEFRQISSGSVVAIKLNEHEYMLTDNQVLQLQRLSDYLKRE